MKSREHVITNGRAVFYASMWEDFKIDFSADLGEDHPDTFQKMSEFMFNVNEIQIVASSVFN